MKHQLKTVDDFMSFLAGFDSEAPVRFIINDSERAFAHELYKSDGTPIVTLRTGLALAQDAVEPWDSPPEAS